MDCFANSAGTVKKWSEIFLAKRGLTHGNAVTPPFSESLGEKNIPGT
jgi:hypothetical protein